MIQIMMAAALAVLAAVRLPVLIRNRSDTVFVAAVCAGSAAAMTNPAVYMATDRALGGFNLARLLLMFLMVLGLWFLRRALLHAVAPETTPGPLRQVPLYTALGLLTGLFIALDPGATTITWGDDYEGRLTGALFSVTGIAFVAWVCGEIAAVCLAHIRDLKGAFRSGFAMVCAGCAIGSLMMTVMAVGVLARALPVLEPLHWRNPDGYRILQLISITLVGAGLTTTAITGHRSRIRTARWEKEALTVIAPIRAAVLARAGLQRTLQSDESAPVQDRLHRMIVEIWDAELAVGPLRNILTPEQRAYLLDVERRLDLEHAG